MVETTNFHHSWYRCLRLPLVGDSVIVAAVVVVVDFIGDNVGSRLTNCCLGTRKFTRWADPLLLLIAEPALGIFLLLPPLPQVILLVVMLKAIP